MAKKGSKNSAGYFGDHNCDLPPWTVEHIIEFIAKSHDDIDYIFLTGDYPARDSWIQSKELNLENMQYVAKIMKKFFKGTRLFSQMIN